MPFRPCAMMLKVNPLGKIKPVEVDEETIQKIMHHMDSEIRSFDYSLKPAVSFGGKISFPSRAERHIALTPSDTDPKSFFELGFIGQQVLLFLSYLRLSYTLFFDGDRILISYSSERAVKSGKPVRKGFAESVMPSAKDLLYFETWGIHPEGFFEDNPKLDSVVRYCRYAPRIVDCCEPRLIMDREYIHLMLRLSNDTPALCDYLNAGMFLLNFIISSEMLGLMGEWKLLREIDTPDKTAFQIPDKTFHFATWHGQLF